jgi:serine/threonine protein kinase
MDSFSPRLIGSGSYGYIHHPPLGIECEEEDEEPIDTFPSTHVSKLMVTKEAEEEMSKYRLLQIADPENEYHLGLPKIGKPKLCAARHIATCFKKPYIDVLTHLDKWRVLIMEHGGISVAKYAELVEKKYDPNEESHRNAVKGFWIEMLRMVYAVNKLIDCGLVHHDFKHYNILYDRHKKRVNLIDFSFLQEMDTIKEQTIKEDEDKDGYEWSLFFFNLPPEIIFYNKKEFETLTEYDYDECERFFNNIYLKDRQFGTEPVRKETATTPSPKTRDTDEDHDLHLKPPSRMTNEERENYFNNIFFLIDQDDEVIREIESMAGETVTLRDYMIENFRQFVFSDVINYCHEEFVHDSLRKFDIFGLGSCFLHTLTHVYRFCDNEFVVDMYKLIRRMLDTNVYTRITIEELMTTYFDILRRHYEFGLDLEDDG